MEDAKYAFFIIFFLFVLLCKASMASATGYFYYERDDAPAPRLQEYYHTPEQYACIIDGQPSALILGNKIANGEISSRQYNHILESYTFSRNVDAIDSIHVAYAFYVIAEIIGDREGKKRQFWLARYIPPVIRQKVTQAIYAKYSPEYLEKCFVLHEDANSRHVNILDVYPLYMD